MQKKGWTVLAVMAGMLLTAGIPNFGPTAVLADPGCGCHEGKGHGGGCGHHEGCGPGCPQHGECPGCPGCGCECGYPGGAVQAIPPCMQDNAAAGPGGMHGMMHGGKDASMKDRMTKHLEEMRGVVKKLREIEAKMAGQIQDGESFRQLSLEHAKLLTDLQASHLRHMEGMTGGGK